MCMYLLLVLFILGSLFIPSVVTFQFEIRNEMKASLLIYGGQVFICNGDYDKLIGKSID